MKTIQFSLTLIILILFFSCKKENPPTTAISVLVDVTDKNFQFPGFVSENIQSVLEMMQINKEEGRFSGGQVKFSLINDLSDSKSELASIKPGKPGLLGENPLIRNDEVDKFCRNLETAFNKIVTTADWGTGESKIYQKVSRELNKLNEQEANQKIMIIFSDMLENSNIFSFYGSNANTNIEKYIESPEKTLEKFSSSGPKINYLNDIKIIVVTNRNSENDKMVNLSERFWTSVFVERGADVSFRSSLN